MTELYSVKQGKLVEWQLSVDPNGEIVAETGDIKNKNYEMLKFPAGLTKAQLNKVFKAHNEANEGKVALTDEQIEASNKTVSDSQKLIDSL